MVKSQRKRTPGQWQAVFYETKGGRSPAREFLAGSDMPMPVRIELLTTIRAVLCVSPLRFRPSGQRWRPMHKPKGKGGVDMSGICEARDKHSNNLYRLFCLIDGEAPAHGLALPSLVLLDGVAKPVRTEVSQADYRRIDRYRNDYWKTRRVARARGVGER